MITGDAKRTVTLGKVAALNGHASSKPALATATPEGRAAFLAQVDLMVKDLKDSGAPEPFTCSFKEGAIDDETAQALRDRGFIVKIEDGP